MPMTDIRVQCSSCNGSSVTANLTPGDSRIGFRMTDSVLRRFTADPGHDRDDTL